MKTNKPVAGALPLLAGFSVVLGYGITYTGSASAQSLEEILVTAERRETLLQDTPVSVMSLDQSQIDALNVDDLQDLQNFIPNLSIGGSVPFASFPNAAIRGIGQATARVNNDRGVALYIDDLYYPRSVGSLVRLLDVERVEVLRGPQGTLFGRNATGGAIRYITRKPDAEFGGEVRGELASYNRRALSATLNVPFSDTVLGRFQIATDERDGFIDVLDRAGNKVSEAGDGDDMSARAALRFLPSEDLTIDFSLSYSKNESSVTPTIIDRTAESNGVRRPAVGVRARNYYWEEVVGQPIMSAQDARLLSPDDETLIFYCVSDATYNPRPSESRLENVVPRDLDQLCATPRNEDEMLFANLDLTYDFNESWSLRSITGWQDLDNYSAPDPLSQGRLRPFDIQTEVFSQELQLHYSTDRLTGLVGLFYYDESVDRLTINNGPFGGGPFSPQCCNFRDEIFQQDVSSVAIFASGTYSVTDALNVTLGLRYSDEEKEGRVAEVSRDTIDIPFDDSWESTDFRLTADYKITDDVMAFATVSTGFKSGGVGAAVISFVPFSGVDGDPGILLEDPEILSFDQEEVTSYELGIRSEWADGRLRANLTAYFMDYENTVIQAPDFSTGGRPQLYQSNAADTEISGVELELMFAATENLILNANVGTIDLEYDRVLVGGKPLLEADQPSACDTSDSAADQWASNCNVQILARTPELSYTLGATYSINLASGTLRLIGTYAYKDEIETNNATDNSRLLDDYGILNLRGVYETDSWEVALYGRNVTDEEYAVSGGSADIFTGAGVSFVHPGRPQEFGVSVSYRFGN